MLADVTVRGPYVLTAKERGAEAASTTRIDKPEQADEINHGLFR
jgi:hypothetical protein